MRRLFCFAAVSLALASTGFTQCHSSPGEGGHGTDEVDDVDSDDDVGSGDDGLAAPVTHLPELEVDKTTVLGSLLPATEVPLSLRSSSGNTAPLNFQANTDPINTWDITPAVSELNGSASITLFGAVPTQYPNTNINGLEFRIKAGTHGEQGVILRPNGVSFFDPDYWAQRARILAIGHPNAEYELDVRDPGNHHASETDCRYDGAQFACRVGNFEGTSHFATGGGADSAYEAVHAYAFGDRSSGTAGLTNYAVRASAVNGQTNFAFYGEQGDNYFNVQSGSTRFGNPTATTVFDGKISTGMGGSTFSAIGAKGYNALFGTEKDGAYFTNGSLNYGWNAQTTDHLNINHSGYLGGGTQFRDLLVYDGRQTRLADFTGVNHWLTMHAVDGTPTIVVAPQLLTHATAGTFDEGSSVSSGTIRNVGAPTTTISLADGGFYKAARCQATPIGDTPQVITVSNNRSAPTFNCFAMTGAPANCVDFNYWCPGT